MYCSNKYCVPPCACDVTEPVVVLAVIRSFKLCERNLLTPIKVLYCELLVRKIHGILKEIRWLLMEKIQLGDFRIRYGRGIVLNSTLQLPTM
jgi:hypothetical protein